jgi:uncharacterized membrane protein YbhN (UPF0104 family)
MAERAKGSNPHPLPADRLKFRYMWPFRGAFDAPAWKDMPTGMHRSREELERDSRWPALARVREAIRHVATLPPWRSWWAGALTLASLSMWLLCLGIIANASGVNLPAHVIVAIAVVTECARLLPISIQGIGVREATFAALAVQAGRVGAAAFAACATAYALHFLLTGLLGIAARTSFDYKQLRRTS